jgi:hypothetical protein
LSNSAQETLRAMGQTIDLFAPASSSNTSVTTSTTKPHDGGTNTHSTVKQPITSTHRERTNSNIHSNEERKKKGKNNHQQIMEHLATMAIVDLLQTVLSSQEERVKTYRLYEQSLDEVLLSGNLTNYPPACATATASFAVLSDTIRAVQHELERRASASAPAAQKDTDTQKNKAEWKNDAQSIQKLQSLEREKLQLTAACHLERIRERNQREELMSQRSSNTNLKARNNNNDAKQQGSEDVNNKGRILSLLQQGISTLQTKIGVCTDQINDVLDELRCALVEEMEGEEEG